MTENKTIRTIDDDIEYEIIYEPSNGRTTKNSLIYGIGRQIGGGILDSQHIKEIRIRYKNKIKNNEWITLNDTLKNVAYESINKAITRINGIKFKNGSSLLKEGEEIPQFNQGNIKDIQEKVENIKDCFFKNILKSSFGFLYFTEGLNLNSLRAIIKDIKLLKDDNHEILLFEDIEINLILKKILNDIYFDKALISNFLSSYDPISIISTNKQSMLSNLKNKIDKIVTTGDTDNIKYLVSILKVVINKELCDKKKLTCKIEGKFDITNSEDYEIAYLDDCITFINYITSPSIVECRNDSCEITNAISLLNCIGDINDRCVNGSCSSKFEVNQTGDDEQDPNDVSEEVTPKFYEKNSLVFKPRHIRIILLYFSNGNDLILKGLDALLFYETICKNEQDQIKFRNDLFNYIAYDKGLGTITNKDLAEKISDIQKLKVRTTSRGGKVVRKYLPGLHKCNDNRRRRVFLIKGYGNTQFILSNNQILKKKDLIKKTK